MNRDEALALVHVLWPEERAVFAERRQRDGVYLVGYTKENHGGALERCVCGLGLSFEEAFAQADKLRLAPLSMPGLSLEETVKAGFAMLAHTVGPAATPAVHPAQMARDFYKCLVAMTTPPGLVPPERSRFNHDALRAYIIFTLSIEDHAGNAVEFLRGCGMTQDDTSEEEALGFRVPTSGAVGRFYLRGVPHQRYDLFLRDTYREGFPSPPATPAVSSWEPGAHVPCRRAVPEVKIRVSALVPNVDFISDTGARDFLAATYGEGIGSQPVRWRPRLPGISQKQVLESFVPVDPQEGEPDAPL